MPHQQTEPALMPVMALSTVSVHDVHDDSMQAMHMRNFEAASHMPRQIAYYNRILVVAMRQPDQQLPQTSS